uniref:CRC domain-containing protein n=1 Tax=Trichuris muris TaxID=70415 RepID=A0A5S6R3T2_TRIMR
MDDRQCMCQLGKNARLAIDPKHITIHRPGPQCKVHSDCKTTSLCFDSHCIAAERVCGSQPCNKDCHCRTSYAHWRNKGRGCKCGRCYELKKPCCSRRECTCSKDCNGLSICIRHHCVAAETTGQLCKKCCDCNKGERCVNGMCLRPLPGAEIDNCSHCPLHCCCRKNTCCCPRSFANVTLAAVDYEKLPCPS